MQSGYESNREAAAEQAGYLFDLQSDVLAQAFDAFMSENLGWMDRDLSRGATSGHKKSDVSRLPSNSVQTFEPWAAAIYLSLHLIPVDLAGRLLHQLRRWRIGTLAAEQEGTLPPATDPKQGDCAQTMERLLSLYLDMHDVKFDGGTPLADRPELQRLFESAELMAKVLPRFGQNIDNRVPLRSLREMLRFGGFSVLAPVFKDHPIKQTSYDLVVKREAPALSPHGSKIADAHACREALHKDLCRRTLGADDQSALAKYLDRTLLISQFRIHSNHVNFVNHTRLHRLLMSVLGRLVDFSGLFERDLYFALLAGMHRAGTKPSAVFSEAKLKKFQDGRVLEALKDTTWGDALKPHLDPILERFGLPSPSATKQKGPGGVAAGQGSRQIRNRLSHFNALRDPEALNLTDLVNQTRTLMSYDRKLKNAVSKAIIGLLEQDNLALRWTMGSDHALRDPVIRPGVIRHLKNAALTETLHGKHYCQMVAALFRGTIEMPEGGLSTCKKADDILALLQKALPMTKEHATARNAG